MQPFRPGTRPSCSSWPGPPQTPGPKSKLSHPSAQPDRGALDESSHVLAANKRYVLPKFPLVQLNQTTAVSRLFLSHAVEYRSGRGKLLAQSFGKICIDALVFFFQRNGQRENLAFRQLVEVLHGTIRLPMRRLGSKPRDLTLNS